MNHWPFAHREHKKDPWWFRFTPMKKRIDWADRIGCGIAYIVGTLFILIAISIIVEAIK